MSTEEEAGLQQWMCLKDISRWDEFMVSECVIFDIGEEEVEKDTGMLRWKGRKVIVFTWMSVILRRGKRRQGRFGVLGENEKYLEREELTVSKMPKQELPSFVCTGSIAYIAFAPRPVC